MVASIRAFVRDANEAGVRDSAQPQERRRRAWAPSEDDHQIYEWVRFDGRSQVWVAAELGISQATVSRVIQRMSGGKRMPTRGREGGSIRPSGPGPSGG